MGAVYIRPNDESLSINLQYVGGRYVDDANSANKRAYYSMDIEASKRLREDVTVKLSVRDIFKPVLLETDDEDEPFIRQPGVLWDLGVACDF